MSERPFRKPNAFKHGAFSSVEFLPWEDASEYEDLRRRLFEEHQPEGPSQEECVDTILSCMWRKRRVRHKRNLDTAAALERIENRVLWEDPPPLFDTKEEGTMYALKNALETRRVDPGRGPRDDYAQLLGFSSNLYGALESGLLRVKISMLPQEFAAHLNEKVPCEKFEKTGHWVVAVKKEVDGVLLPMVRGRAPEHNTHFETAAAFLTGDRILEDLEIDERLDASKDRALKRLYQLKMARQLYAPKQPRLIENKSPPQLAPPEAKAKKTEK